MVLTAGWALGPQVGPVLARSGLGSLAFLICTHGCDCRVGPGPLGGPSVGKEWVRASPGPLGGPSVGKEWVRVTGFPDLHQWL